MPMGRAASPVISGACTTEECWLGWLAASPCYAADPKVAVSPSTYQSQLPLDAIACRFVHGEEGLVQALKATEALRPGAATALDATTLEAIAGDAPSCNLAASQCTNVPLVDVMVASGMLKSKGEVRARRSGHACLSCRAAVTLQGPARFMSGLALGHAHACLCAYVCWHHADFACVCAGIRGLRSAVRRSSASSRVVACTSTMPR